MFAFIYSTCRDTCPAQVQTIRGALDDLSRSFPVIGVSVDPANDTPRSAQAFLLEQKKSGGYGYKADGVKLGDARAIVFW